LWDSLFLSTDEIATLAKYVEEHAYKPFIYPMFLTAAHTGARRSELIRSQAEDIDFASKVITIRERKRERGHHGSRSVPLSPLLAKVLKKWLAGRTSGPTFQWKGVPIERDEAHSHLQLTLANSKWEKVKGWHTLRHSMASNLAAKGIDQRVINELLGHVSEQTAARYRHFTPNIKAGAVQAVFG
jgi:integrase